MSAECIHGFDDGLCAICFPKAPPEVPAKAPARVQHVSADGRVRPATKRVAGAAAAGARGSVSKRPVDVGEQRIYHVTHISNLEQILASRRILADANDERDERPTVDISSTETRERRRTTAVSEVVGHSIASYVPFFLSPDASVWNSIRSQTADVRLSSDAYDKRVYDYVILVSTVKAVGGATTGTDDTDEPAVIMTDGDAAGTLTRFGSRDTLARMLRNLHADEDSDALLQAEVLVPDAVPFEQVTLIGVANDKVRASVKRVLEQAAHRPKIAVYPPWFQPDGE